MIIINSAGGWIENDQGHVLLQLRSPTEEQWGFPGGILEVGESVADAAIREVLEETGLQAIPTALIGVYSKYFTTLTDGRSCQTITTMFKMKVTGGDLTLDHIETFDLRYFPLDAMPVLCSSQHNAIADDVRTGNVPAFR
ncbi:8-oxo-dGTP pyrophosphatase MutT (NUDIX family) [Pseudorhizobium tarimense]|uniref:8-oxo-dGTP pyrophosphatase MutT (NUDIX family) n=1 Tax=Pseudorhizobium tarimense TaxID=1079109 RepID=A0ABV2HCA9_9HYPH|nr:NUDIX domain-containing protein [Pseudorhizobium tarimense]MCJ8521233.1 NUDIX domain-containing protein [Pseudorhizobium tarimense]